MEVIPLNRCREHIPVLAGWFHEQWGRHDQNRSIAAIENRLTQAVESDQFPVILVGFLEGQPVATATLKIREMSTHPHLEHWLGTVFVLPEFRRRGLAREIVSQAVDHARQRGVGTLHLYTPDQERLYFRLGWEPVERTRYDDKDVVVMKREIVGQGDR